MEKQEVVLGCECRDIITGFKGIATGRVKYLSGCDQILISAKITKGGEATTLWCDLQRVEVIGSKVVKLDNSKTPGY